MILMLIKLETYLILLKTIIIRILFNIWLMNRYFKKLIYLKRYKI